MARKSHCRVVCSVRIDDRPEAARYLETFKAYENKTAELIQSRREQDFLPVAQDVLTCAPKVNKTDVATLLANFGSVRGVLGAGAEAMSLCVGLGEKKVRRLHAAFGMPLSSTAAHKAARRAAAACAA